jgi:hypothetical protein
MTEFWMIINDESEQLMNNEEGSSLVFSSQEQAESYIKEQGVNGIIVKTPDVTEGIP